LFSVGKGFISVGVVGQSALGLLTVVQKWPKAEVLIVTSVILTYVLTYLLIYLITYLLNHLLTYIITYLLT
jgi:hypothetical protein